MAAPKKEASPVAIVKAFNALEKAKLDEAATARLTALTAFLVAFAPSPGSTVADADVHPVDDGVDPSVLASRESAVITAFDAVRSIARAS
jgi:hypothetical protein